MIDHQNLADPTTQQVVHQIMNHVQLAQCNQFEIIPHQSQNYMINNMNINNTIIMSNQQFSMNQANFCLQENICKKSSKINHSNNSQQKFKQIKSHPKMKFTNQEDLQLLELVKKYGTNNWYQVSKEMKGRNIRQCRERYRNYLTPEVTNGPWTKEEDDLLFELFSKYGARWKMIARFFPSRTDINIKSRWHVHFRKYIRQTKNIVKKKASFNQKNIVCNYNANNIFVSSQCNSYGNNFNNISLIPRKSIFSSTLPLPPFSNINNNSNECKNGIQHDEKQSLNSSKIGNEESSSLESYFEKNNRNEFDEICDNFFDTSFIDEYI